MISSCFRWFSPVVCSSSDLKILQTSQGSRDNQWCWRCCEESEDSDSQQNHSSSSLSSLHLLQSRRLCQWCDSCQWYHLSNTCQTHKHRSRTRCSHKNFLMKYIKMKDEGEIQKFRVQQYILNPNSNLKSLHYILLHTLSSFHGHPV